MSSRLTCSRGHTWEVSDEPGGRSGHSTCPVCSEPTPRPPSVAPTRVSLAPARVTVVGGDARRGTHPDTMAYTPSADVTRTQFDPDAHPGAGVTRIAALPGYALLAEIGRGGMGVVYRANQVRADRLVALKMVLAGSHAHPRSLARFRTEAEAVARLAHPNIVQVYEVGEHDGLPFFSMELCTGGSLDRKLARAPLPARQSAELVEKLAQAMQAAHDRQVIHRDLKPANVLLTESGEPKITDFGVAKKMDTDGGTAAGAVLGTPEYMAPEQASGHVDLVGPRADVYSLGAILYECLTGRPPFKAPTPLETMTRVVRDEPVPPSQLVAHLPADLETVCLKCLEKRVSARYPTAAALAEDLHSFLAGEPIRARPVGRWERLWKWAQRRPAAAALAGISGLAVLALVALGVALFYYPRLQSALSEAEAQRTLAEEGRDEADFQRKEADWQRTRAEEQARLVRRFLYSTRINLAQRAWQSNQAGLVGKLLRECEPDESGADLRGFEWHYLRHLTRAELLSLSGHADVVEAVAFSPDGKLLASRDRADNVKTWDLATGRDVCTFAGATGGLAFSPDSKWLASGGRAKAVQVWDARTAVIGFQFGDGPGRARAVAFAPDGRRLAAADDQGVRVWEKDTGKLARTFRVANAFAVTSIAWGPDGKHLAAAIWPQGNSGARVHGVRVWDVDTGAERHSLRGHGDVVDGVAYSPDGIRIATASRDHTVRTWDAGTGQGLLTIKGFADEVHGIAFSPDGQRVASASADRTVRVHDATTGEEISVLHGHAEPVTCVAFGPSGRLLASGGLTREVKVWDAIDPPEGRAVPTGAAEPGSVVAFSPDGARFATASRNLAADGSEPRAAVVRMCDTRTGEELRAFAGMPVPVTALAFSPDGRYLAAGGGDLATGMVHVWDVASGKSVVTGARLSFGVSCLAFSPDGRQLGAATGMLFTTHSRPAEVKIWDLPAGHERCTFAGHRTRVMGLAFSPDGRRVASCGENEERRDNGEHNTIREIKLWDADSGRERWTIPAAHDETITSVAFSPDSLKVASGSLDRAVKLWDSATGRPLRTLLGHRHWVTKVIFSPDGGKVASASADHTVKVWDAESGTDLLALEGHAAAVEALAFTTDGRQLLSGGNDGSIKVWDSNDPPAAPPTNDPRWAGWHNRRALAAEEAHRWFAAAFHLTQYMQTAPVSRAHFERRARAHLEMGQWQQALADCDKAIDRGAAGAEVWMCRGAAHAGLHRWKEAHADYSQVLALAPKDGSALSCRGMVAGRLGRWLEAVADQTRAIELNPRDARAYARRADAYAELQEWRPAIDDLSRCLDTSKPDSRALMRLAIAQLARGDHAGYRSTCNQALDLFGRQGEPDDLGRVAWMCAVAPEAVDDRSWPVLLAGQAAAAAPKDAVKLAALGACLYRAGQWKRAAERFDEAIAVQREAAPVDALYLAMANQRLGHHDEARRHLAHAAELEARQKEKGDVPAWPERVVVRLLRQEAETVVGNAKSGAE